jgi:outer membrane autotransporter protein
MDLYGKYFWTHQQGDSITLSSGDPVKFDGVDSHRLRLGGRLSGTANWLNPYIGAALEHEFDGKAKASTHGFAIDAPSLSGTTGIGELGFEWKPRRNLSFDLGVQGYVGKREGCTASLAAGWVF